MSCNELPVVTLFIPEKNQLIQIEEGSGCNLDRNDRAKGIVDYINYSVFDLSDIIREESDGGQLDYDFYVGVKHKSLTELIGEVLHAIYDTSEIAYTILSEGKECRLI